MLDGLEVLTSRLTRALSRCWMAWPSSTVGAGLAAMLASGFQRLWLAPLRHQTASLDQNALPAYAGAGMPEVIILDNAVRRHQERTRTRLDQSQRQRTELRAIFNQRATFCTTRLRDLADRPPLADLPGEELGGERELLEV